jgi:hypothetical protein
MQNVTGVKPAIGPGVLGGYGYLFEHGGEVPPTPDEFSLTPSADVPPEEASDGE